MLRFLLFAVLAAPVATASEWGDGFANPGPEFSPGVYWWWFGPAQTKPEIVRELQVMRHAGIGRVLIYPIYPIAPDDAATGLRNFGFLSREFDDTLRYGVEEAHRNGMEVAIPLGSGWPYGGPRVRLEDAAERLIMIRQPAQAGGRPPVPLLETGDSVVCRLLLPGKGDRVDLGRAVDVTAKPALPRVLQGPHVLLTFLARPTGMKVKRAALGGEGLVLDHLSRKALDSYLAKAGAKLIPVLRAGSSVHEDSFEVYGQCWTKDFLDQFQRRRGYNLRLYLPALFLDAGSHTADVRYDFWRTVADIVVENHIRPLSAWVHRHGSTLQAESYGTPAIDMRGYEYVDQPMRESYDWKNFVASRWAASSAHQTRRRFVAAETWTWLRQPRYVATLEDLKRGADLQFLCGINRIVGQGYAYSPPDAGIPGWGYYASVMLNDNNPWWPYFHLLADYLRRTSYATSLGKARADVALYLPEEDALAAQAIDSGNDLYRSTMNLYFAVKDRLSRTKRVEFGLPDALRSESSDITAILDAGFAFDGIDRSVLRPGLLPERGRIEIGDATYRIVILPNLIGISPGLLEKIAAFCRSGGMSSLPAACRIARMASPAPVSGKSAFGISSALCSGVDRLTNCAATALVAVRQFLCLKREMPCALFFPSFPRRSRWSPITRICTSSNVETPGMSCTLL